MIRNESYEIRLGGSPTVAATINGGVPKVDVLDLDLGNVSQSGAQPVRLKGIVVKLNAASAAALSTTAGVVPPLAAGAPAGTAEIFMNIR